MSEQVEFDENKPFEVVGFDDSQGFDENKPFEIVGFEGDAPQASALSAAGGADVAVFDENKPFKVIGRDTTLLPPEEKQLAMRRNPLDRTIEEDHPWLKAAHAASSMDWFRKWTSDKLRDNELDMSG